MNTNKHAQTPNFPFRRNLLGSIKKFPLKDIGLIFFCFLLSITGIYAQNNALSFDGVDDYAEITAQGTGILGDNSSNSSFTIEMWLKIDDPSAFSTLVSKHSNSTTRKGFFIEKDSNGSLKAGIGNSSNGWSVVSGTDSITIGKWHHVALTYSSTGNNIALYIDGKLQGSALSGFSPVFDDMVNFRLASSEYYSTYSRVVIDEVRIWDTARTAGEINDNMYLETDDSPIGLLVYYSLNQGTAGSDNSGISALIDGSGNGTDAALNNFALTGNGSNFIEGVSSTPSGSGTSTDPYLISTLNNLYWVSQNSSVWGLYFVQTADIDASVTSTWNSGEGFSPIGNSTTKFTGHYNGKGHTVSSLYINRPSVKYVGLFGYFYGATSVDSLRVTNANITGSSYVGPLVGYNTGTVTSCYASGTVSATGTATNDGYIGGLVGYSSKTVSHCYTNTSVTGAYYVGGLAGYNKSTIQNCYALGSVTGTKQYTGGLVGYNYSTGIINNCYSTGVVTGVADVGGLVGKNSKTVSNSFWDKETSGMTSSAGGTGKTTAQMKEESTFTAVGWDFIGPNINGTENIWGISSDYNSGYPHFFQQDDILYIKDISDITVSSAIVAGQINPSSTIDILDHGVCWGLTDNPRLDDNKISLGATSISENFSFSATLTGLESAKQYYTRTYLITTSNDTLFSNVHAFITIGGSGTSADPYRIATLNDLKLLSETSDVWHAYFVQTANIDASETSSWNSGSGFSTIGNSETAFIGRYNGKGHAVNGLFINRPSNKYIGMFGYMKGGSIDSISVTDANIKGFQYTGTLVGYLSFNATVTSCYASGTVSSLSIEIGGLIGESYQSTVNNCHASTSVSGDKYVGGLVGYITYGTLQNSYATGTVTGTGNGSGNGGLLGCNSVGTVTNCYATGTVSGITNSGGLVGYNYGGTLQNCYATGNVTGTGQYTGGLLGNNGTYGTVSKCFSTGIVSGTTNVGGLVGYNTKTVEYSFWDTETSGQFASDGGEGKTTTEMKQQSTFTGVDWDFSSIWAIQEETTYPYFRTASAPAITSVSPNTGSVSGGVPVIITGTNFTGAVSVKFGNTSATGYTVDSDTQITVVSPVGAAGTVDITVTTTGGGTSATNAADQFTYSTATGLGNTGQGILTVYPNPFTDYIIVKLDKVQTLKLFSISGQCLINAIVFEGNNRIDVQSLPKGTYLLKAGNKLVKLVK